MRYFDAVSLLSSRISYTHYRRLLYSRESTWRALRYPQISWHTCVKRRWEAVARYVCEIPFLFHIFVGTKWEYEGMKEYVRRLVKCSVGYIDTVWNAINTVCFIKHFVCFVFILTHLLCERYLYITPYYITPYYITSQGHRAEIAAARVALASAGML